MPAADPTRCPPLLTGSLKLRPGAGCRRLRPVLRGASAAASPPPLFSLSGPRAALYIESIDITLGGTRRGIEAAGAAALKLTDVAISGGSAPEGGCIKLTNTAATLTRGSLSGCVATAADGGGVWATTDGGYTGPSPALRVSRTRVTNNQVGARLYSKCALV